MPAPGGHSGQGVPDLAQQRHKDLPLSRRQRGEQLSFRGLHALMDLADLLFAECRPFTASHQAIQLTRVTATKENPSINTS